MNLSRLTIVSITIDVNPTIVEREKYRALKKDPKAGKGVLQNGEAEDMTIDLRLG